MKVFQTLPLLEKAYPYLSHKLLENSCPASGFDMTHPDFNFMKDLGGDVYVLESRDDAWNCLEGNRFDIIETIGEGWYMFVLINNNGGGPTYFIHEENLGGVIPLQG